MTDSVVLGNDRDHGLRISLNRSLLVHQNDLRCRCLLAAIQTLVEITTTMARR